MKKKIAHTIEAGRFGGPNRTIVEICKSLKDEFEFIVISGNEDSTQFKNELNTLSIKSYLLNLTRLRLSVYQFLKYLFRFFYEVFCIYRILKKEKVDVIHNHTYLDFKAIIVGRMLNKPVIWHLHSSILPRNIKPVFRMFLFLHKGNKICVSKLTKQVFLSNWKGSEATIIQSPVDVNTFKFEPKQSPKLKTNRSIDICSVANFHKDKGQKLLIEAFSLLLKSGEIVDKDLLLHLKGKIYDNNKDYYNELLHLIEKLGISNHVVIDSDEKNLVSDFLKGKDVFVLPSKAEASPISVWEAAATGIPLICTDVGDVKYFIEKYNCGAVLNKYDGNELMELMLHVLQSENYQGYSNNCKAMVDIEFSSSVVREQYLEVYDSLMFNK